MGCNCKSKRLVDTSEVKSTDSYKAALAGYSVDSIRSLPLHSCQQECDGVGEILKFPSYKWIAADYEDACRIAKERVAPLGSPCIVRYYLDTPDPSYEGEGGKTGMILVISNSYGNDPLILG